MRLLFLLLFRCWPFPFAATLMVLSDHAWLCPGVCRIARAPHVLRWLNRHAWPELRQLVQAPGPNPRPVQP
jgi:hypothetical protein